MAESKSFQTTSTDLAKPGVAATSRQSRGVRSEGWAAVWPVALMLALTLGAVAGWVALYRWYGVFEHRDAIHFSFEKIVGGFDSTQIRQTLIVFAGISTAYGVAIAILRRDPVPSIVVRALAIVMFVAPALASVALYPMGALDVFNYMIELKLAYHYDENPYLVTFQGYRADSYAQPAFLVDIPLFYGPAWLLASWLPTAVGGFYELLQTLLALKVFNALLVAATGLLIAWHHRYGTAGWIAAFVFVANPLVLFEGLANAHNDVLLTLFLVAAMVALSRKSPFAWPFLALSALVKLYTVVLIPVFIAVAVRSRWGWKRAIVSGVLSLVVVAVVCAPFWGDGQLLSGLRRGLDESQDMDHVSLYSLAQQDEQEKVADGVINANLIRERPSAEIVGNATQELLRNGFGVLFTILALGTAVAVWRGWPFELAVGTTLLLLMLLLTNFYGWYLIPVIAVLAMHLNRVGLVYIVCATLLGLAYYPMYVYAHFNTQWTRYEVHLFLALFLTLPALCYLLVGGGRAVLARHIAKTASVA